jgi:rubredoxin
MIDCSMCGHSFTREEGAACRSGCPMSVGCGMVTCPSCGYEFPRESKLVTLLTNLVRRRAHRSAEATQ